ncbi:hypothetical protein [Krasilnikovia sp. M28-CT-15]|uniref:hypothetical protein n=1 Tax=Krasilnikovia sp. M28-CT-15 TaxID=3373540 RepID=UPI00399C71D4
MDAVQPELIEVDGRQVARRLYVDEIRYTPKACVLVVQVENDQLINVEGTADTEIYNESGHLIGSLGQLVIELAHLEKVTRYFNFEAHHHPERDALKAFEVGVDIHQLGYRLKHLETGALHLVVRLLITGSFEYKQHELNLAFAKIGERTYASTESPLLDTPGVWVGTSNPTAKQAKLSWRSIGKPKVALQPVEEARFPGLMDLDWPRHPKDQPSSESGDASRLFDPLQPDSANEPNDHDR